MNTLKLKYFKHVIIMILINLSKFLANPNGFIFNSKDLICPIKCGYILKDFRETGKIDFTQIQAYHTTQITMHNFTTMKLLDLDELNIIHAKISNSNETLISLKRVINDLLVYHTRTKSTFGFLKVFLEFPNMQITNSNEIQMVLENYTMDLEFLRKIPINMEIYFNFDGWTNISWEIYGLKNILIISPLSNEFILNNSFIQRRENFRGIEMFIGESIQQDSFDEFYHQEIASIFETTLNFRGKFKSHEVADDISLNGTVSGMVYWLTDGTADLALYPLAYSEKRFHYFDFLHSSPPFRIKIIAVFRQPSSFLQPDFYLYWDLFSKSLWLTWLVTIIILGMSYYYFAKMVNKNNNYLNKSETSALSKAGAGDDNWMNIFTWGVSLSCQQGWYNSPDSTSLKMLFICGLFMSMLYISSFSATLAPKLSLNNVRIKTYQDLIASEMEITAPLGPHGINTALRNAYEERKRAEEFKTLFKDYKEEFNLEDYYDEIIADNNSWLAIISFPDTFYAYLDFEGISHSQICGHVYTIPVPFETMARAFTIPKNSNFKEFYNNKFLLASERGIIHRTIITKERYVQPQCLNNVQEKSLGFFDIFTAFIVWFVGLLISLVIFIVELFYG